MLVRDVLGTCLMLATSVRKHKLAGHFDGLSDFATLILYSGAGGDLVHNYGTKGYLGLIPVAVTGDLTTRFSTKYGDRIMEKFAADGLKGLATWGLSFLSRTRLHRQRHPASPVVEKPKG